jgi:hypothetical protein
MIKIHDVEQGSEEWHQLRCGIITASQMHLILTPTLKIADNDKTRAHVYEIAAHRITKYVEPTFIGDNAIRGHTDEIKARDLYSENYEEVIQVGFITRGIDGVIIGYSPDGMAVTELGGIEAKSRKQKFQVETIATNEVPKDHIMQCQTALFVTDWEWLDYVSYCGGMPMWVIRVFRDPSYQAAILNAVIAFEMKVKDVIDAYYNNLDCAVVIETERVETLDLNDGEYE